MDWMALIALSSKGGRHATPSHGLRLPVLGGPPLACLCWSPTPAAMQELLPGPNLPLELSTLCACPFLYTTPFIMKDKRTRKKHVNPSKERDANRLSLPVWLLARSGNPRWRETHEGL